jgi:hypothetical protein
VTIAASTSQTSHQGTDQPSRHVPVNSNASPDQVAASCPDIDPGIPLLALAYPEFSIGQSSRGRHGPTWTVIRKDPTQPGLYAVVTPDLDELRAVLARHATWQADGSDPET